MDLPNGYCIAMPKALPRVKQPLGGPVKNGAILQSLASSGGSFSVLSLTFGRQLKLEVFSKIRS